MAKRDYYDVLGIGKDADQGSIKSAYRKLALKYHPDRNQGDSEAEEMFKEASEAYEILSDQEKRAVYDQHGHAGLGGGGFEWSDFSHASDFQDIFGNIFDNFFGGSGRTTRQSGPPKGRDLKIKVTLSLEEVATGVEKQINLTRQQGCNTCNASGAAEGSQAQKCSTCGGMGQVQQVARTIFGQQMTVTACPNCGGEGTIVSNPCSDCNGEGRVRARSNLNVRIPAGVQEGNYIPLRGEGEIGLRGGPAGDLLVFIEEEEHSHFSRDGNDVILRLPVGFAQATLGCEIEVPTLQGKALLKIPSGTQTGRVFRMNRKGIPDVNGRGTGDQLVQILIWTPQNLNSSERKLFEQLVEMEDERIRSEGESFFDRVRKAFS